MIRNREELTQAVGDKNMEISDGDIKTAFLTLVNFLRQHHTIHNPSSVPKLDDYRVSLGRFGSLCEALAAASGLDFHTFDSLSQGSGVSTGVFIDRVYLEALLEESQNQALVDAVKKVTRLPEE